MRSGPATSVTDKPRRTPLQGKVTRSGAPHGVLHLIAPRVARCPSDCYFRLRCRPLERRRKLTIVPAQCPTPYFFQDLDLIRTPKIIKCEMSTNGA